MQYHVMWVENGRIFREPIPKTGDVLTERAQAVSLANELKKSSAKVSDVKLYRATDMSQEYNF